MSNYDKILPTIEKIKNGEIFRIEYITDVPLKALERLNGYRCIKVCEKCVRTGVKYQNIESVKKTTIDGVQKNKHSGYEWVIQNKVKHNTNTDKNYFVCATVPKHSNEHSVYIMYDRDGAATRMSREELFLSNKAINSYFNSDDRPIFSIGFDNILKIGKVGMLG